MHASPLYSLDNGNVYFSIQESVIIIFIRIVLTVMLRISIDLAFRY